MPAYTTDTGDTGSRRQTVATVLLVLLAFILAYLPPERQQLVASALRSTVLLPFVTAQRGLTEARVRATEGETLRRQLDSLVSVMTEQRSLAEENRRLRGLLELRERLGTGFVPASVVRARTTGSESMFLLDVGTEHGVEVYAPVLTRQGLVGMVREVRARSAIGIDWTHPDFRASASDAAGLTYGIVQSRRGEFREEDRLEYNGTAFHTQLEDGTVVVTSGLGAVFPKGIPIGKVDGLAEADAGWRKSYWLRPMVPPGAVTHVLVGTTDGTGGDLSPAFPPDSALTEAEVVERELAREDSLRALADSVRLLRTILLASRPLRDSILSRILPLPSLDSAGQDTVPGSSGSPTATVPAAPAPTSAGGAAGAQPRTNAPGPSAPAFPPPGDTVRVGGGRDAAPADTPRADTARRDTLLLSLGGGRGPGVGSVAAPSGGRLPGGERRPAGTPVRRDGEEGGSGDR